MNTTIPKKLHLPLLIGGVAALMLSTAALTSTSDWNLMSSPKAEVQPGQDDLTDSSTNALGNRSRCDECGVIESVRRAVQVGNATASYDIRVRLGDGSVHTISDSSPANWRAGERTILIAGRDHSSK